MKEIKDLQNCIRERRAAVTVTATDTRTTPFSFDERGVELVRELNSILDSLEIVKEQVRRGINGANIYLADNS